MGLKHDVFMTLIFMSQIADWLIHLRVGKVHSALQEYIWLTLYTYNEVSQLMCGVILMEWNFSSGKLSHKG